MADFRKGILDGLIEAEKNYQTAEHLVSVTYPVVKDAKLFLKALEKLAETLKISISLILKVEYFYKRVSLTGDTSKNLEVFFSKCSVKYGLSADDCLVLRRILALEKKHKESGFEFSKSGKLIIMDDDLGISSLDFDSMKKFVGVVGRLLKNTNINFKGIF